MKHTKKCSSARAVLKSTSWAVILTVLASTGGSAYATPAEEVPGEETSRQRSVAGVRTPDPITRSMRKQQHRGIFEQRYSNPDRATLCALVASGTLLMLMTIYATVLS